MSHPLPLTDIQQRLLQALKDHGQWIGRPALSALSGVPVESVANHIYQIKRKLGERSGVVSDGSGTSSRGYRYVAPGPWRGGGIDPATSPVDSLAQDALAVSAAVNGSTALLRAQLRTGQHHLSPAAAARLCTELGVRL